jgi:inosose dehydratase
MSVLARIAGAPISWGVCEVPGWGHQLRPRRVLAEMRDAGLAACEFGPDGFLPVEPAAKAELVAEFGLAAVGGFVPVVLHDADIDPAPLVSRALDELAAAGAGVLVLAAVTGLDGYERRPEIGDTYWRTLLTNLDRAVRAAAERGVVATLHPHVGTMVERAAEVLRVLEGSMVPLCLDTGHLLVGGTDPVELAVAYPERIAHVHLKDVDAAVAERVRTGELGYADAVRRGMYRPLGLGALDVAGIVSALEGSGYRGWYVIEQDTVLDAEPAPGRGPVEDVRMSLTFLRGLAP